MMQALGARPAERPDEAKRLKQSFCNKTDRSQFIILELSTSRFRLSPGQELILLHYRDDVVDGPDAPLRVEFIDNYGSLEIVVWTAEYQLYMPDGTPAPQDFGR